MMYDEAGLDKLFLALNRYCEDYIALRQFADWQNEYGNPVMAIQLHLIADHLSCLLYTSPSPRDRTRSRMPSSA